MRNILIVLAIAALVVAIPGGGRAAQVAIQAVSLAFLAAIAWFAAVMYRQHRLTLYGLGEKRRAALYAAVGVATLTLTGTNRLLHSGSGTVAWIALLGVAAYTIVAVIWSARRY